MKIQYAIVLGLALGITACGKSEKEQAKQRFLDKCISESGKQVVDPKMRGLMDSYCHCITDKIAANLTPKEMDSLDKLNNENGGPQMEERLRPLLEPCVKELQEKARAAMPQQPQGGQQPQQGQMQPQDGQMQPQPAPQQAQ